MKILFILFLTVLTSCSLSKTTRLLKNGNVEQKEFYGKIQYESKAGLPIIKVEINGVSANFLFDTGAPNVISVELATRLNLITETTGYVRDSGGKQVIQEYVTIDNITIDSINFLNTSAIVADLSSSEVTSCFKLDGIIGANLMRTAFWKIVYSENSIYFSQNLSKLKDVADWKTLKFTPNRAGTPKVDLELNNKKVESLTFDTGSNGHISISKNVFSALCSENPDIKKTYRTGSVTFGYNGLNKVDTTYYAKINKILIGDLELDNNIIEFKEYSNIIGSKFLSNYTVILDWTSNLIYFKETTNYSFDSLKTFGFKVLLQDNKIIVGSTFSEGQNSTKLKIGDEILEVNGENYQGYIDSSLCELYMNGIFSFNNADDLKLKIKRGSEILNMNLAKETLLK
jgi:hypothetical protein